MHEDLLPQDQTLWQLTTTKLQSCGFSVPDVVFSLTPGRVINERAGREGETAGVNSLNAILQVEQTKVQAKAREVILNRKLQGLTGA